MKPTVFGNTRRRLAAVLAAILVGLGFVAVTAAPAQASSSDCYYNHFCIWQSAGFPGTPSYSWYVGPGSGGFCVNFPGSHNDNTDSAAVSGSYIRSATIYKDINCAGGAVYFLQTAAYGGPSAATCNTSILDNWACYFGQTGQLPSSAWILRP